MSVAQFWSTSSGSMRSRDSRGWAMGDGRSRIALARLSWRGTTSAVFATLIAVAPPPSPIAAQRPDSAAFYKALDLETSGKYKEAVPLFRAALHSSAGTSALLGLERVYAELGWADSLLAPLDTLIAGNPREPIFRTVQLRTL